MSRIAQPAFNGAPTDDLAAVDVYGEVDTQRRNEFVSTFSAFGQDLKHSLGQQRSTLAEIGSALRTKEIGLKTAKERVLGVVSNARSVVDNLSGSFQNTLVESLGQDDEDTLSKQQWLQVKLEDSIHLIKSGDVKSATGIATLLGDLTGDGSFLSVLDIQTELALFQGILEEVAHWELPELIDEILTQVGDEDKQRQIVQGAAKQYVTSSDIDGVEALLGHTSPAALLVNYPDYPRRLLQQYKFKDGTTQGDYPDRHAQLFRVMDQLHPQWFLTDRNGEAVYNLSFLAYASDDARVLLLSDEATRPPALIAQNHPKRDVKGIMRGMYPLMPIYA